MDKNLINACYFDLRPGAYNSRSCSQLQGSRLVDHNLTVPMNQPNDLIVHCPSLF